MMNDNDVIKKVISVLDESVDRLDGSILKKLEHARYVALSNKKDKGFSFFDLIKLDNFRIVGGLSVALFLGIFSYVSMQGMETDVVNTSEFAVLEGYQKLYESCDYYKLNPTTNEITVNTSC